MESKRCCGWYMAVLPTLADFNKEILNFKFYDWKALNAYFGTTNLGLIKKLVTLVTGGGTWKELEDVGCVLHYSWGAINQFHLTVPKGALNSYFSNAGFAFDYNLCEINSRS